MQKGQIILVLILIMTVALAIGLSIVQKSLVDVSTSSKVEQSSRAFSAAEAGIEKALRGDSACTAAACPTFSQNNASITQIYDSGLTPYVVDNVRQSPWESPDLSKEDIAQVWLADLNSVSNPPAGFYTQNTLDVYWGNSSTDKAALELTLIYYDGSSYRSRKWYLDNTAASRNPANGFDTVNCPATYSFGTNTYQCKKTLGDGTGLNNGLLPTGLMLVRARLLYNTTSQPFAVQAVGTVGSCTGGCAIPPQKRTIYSSGVSGDTQRGIKLDQSDKVVNFLFDYAIFSAGDINK